MRQIAATQAERARAHPRPPRPPGLEPRDLRAAARSRCGAARATCPRWRRPAGSATRRRPACVNKLQRRFWTGPPHPVARALVEGDEVARLHRAGEPRVTRAGHVAYWRESDRVLILGDVLNNMNVRTGIPGLHEPPAIFTPDPARNRVSRAPARRAAAAAARASATARRCATPAGSPTSSRDWTTERSMADSIFLAASSPHRPQGVTAALHADRARPRPLGPARAARRRTRGADRAPRSSGWSRARSCASRGSASSCCARSRSRH